MPSSPLVIQTVCFHPDDHAATAELGGLLYEQLTRPRARPLAFGPGIPVRVATDPARVLAATADHNLVVPVLGASAFRDKDSRQRTREAIEAWHDTLGDGHVVPVLLDEVWRTASAVEELTPILSRLYGADPNSWSATIINVVLAACRLLSSDGGSPTIFVSHAKADLSSTANLAETIRDFIKTQTVGDAFFDTTDLEQGRGIRKQLARATGRGILLMVRGDMFSSRPWCQSELLHAKLEGLPTLTVEALDTGDHRTYPYAGNGPSVLWRPDAGVAPIVLRTMVEWLRARHFELEAERIAANLPNPVISKRPPELLDLAQGPLRHTGPIVVLHPDPELSVVERQVLRDARPRMRLATPSTIYRGLSPRVRAEPGAQSTGRKFMPADTAWMTLPLAGREVAISLSDVAEREIAEEGLVADHVEDATVSIARALLSSGAALAYGGDHRFGGFDAFLADLVVAYNASTGAEEDFLISYLSAFIPKSQTLTKTAFTERSLARTPKFAAQVLLTMPGPAPLSAARKALHVSDMRRVMSLNGFARVVIGGQTEPRRNGAQPGVGYGGAYPGVVEEAWRSLSHGLPLYVVGAFGGAARVVADLLEDRPTPTAMLASTFAGDEFSEFRACASEFASDPDRAALGVPADLQEMAEAIRAAGKARLADDASALAWNGLDVAENKELFRSQDPVAITALMMKGLYRKCREQCAGALRIELVRGSITQVDAVDAVSVATFRNVPFGGAGAVLDRVLNSRLSTALKERQTVVESQGDEIDADWLVVADLGDLTPGALEAVPGAIESAASQVAETAQRYGFRRVALVTFCGNVVEDLSVVVERMLAGLKSAAHTTVFQWFETDPEKFQGLRRILEQRDRVVLSTRELPMPELPPPSTRARDFFATIRYENETLHATLLPPGGTAAALSVTTPLPKSTFTSIARSDDRQAPPSSALDRIGDQLATALFGEAGRHLLEHNKGYRLVIQHDLESGGLPFETLRVGDHRFSLEQGVVRRPALGGLRPDDVMTRPAHVGALGVLLVVNPLDDLPQTEIEADAVQRALAASDDVRVRRVLRGSQATKEAVLEALRDPDVQVFHYSGHAFYDGTGEDGSGLVCAGGERLFLRDLLTQEVTPNVAFFNACSSGRVRGQQVADSTPPELARAFAEYFLRSRVEAYLGTFWPVLDAGAATFAANVYRELAAGAKLDSAVRTARNVLYAANRNPDWANYVLFGDGDFRLSAGTSG